MKRYSAKNTGHEEDTNSEYEDADGPFVLFEDTEKLVKAAVHLLRLASSTHNFLPAPTDKQWQEALEDLEIAIN